jgi:hypothetical protein
MKADDFKYLEGELLRVSPFPPADCGPFKMQIFSKHGRTKWLNITPEQFREIEDVLYGIKPGTKLVGQKLEN